MKEGPFGLTRQGLENILTNPVYIGWWYHKQQGKSAVIIKNNHGAIVKEDDFWYAFNLLSPTTITGEANNLRKNKPPVRFDRVGTIPAQALLDGILKSPLEKHSVYVFENNGKPEKAIYGIDGRNHPATENDPKASILVRDLDSIFTQRLVYRLRLFQAMDAVRALVEPGRPREDSVFQYLKQVQETIAESNAGVKAQLEEYIKEAASLENTLHYGAEALDKGTIIKFSQRLANLKTTIEVLSRKDDEAAKTEEALKDSVRLLTDASIDYDKFPFERKQKLVRLVTTKIELGVPSPRWLSLEIVWSTFMNVSVNDIAFIWRPHGSGGRWSETEDEVLKNMYEAEDRDSILQKLPHRSWGSILHQAHRLGLNRPNNLGNNSSLLAMLSYHDQKIMQEKELEFDMVNDLEKRIWWKTVAVQKR